MGKRERAEGRWGRPQVRGHLRGRGYVGGVAGVGGGGDASAGGGGVQEGVETGEGTDEVDIEDLASPLELHRKRGKKAVFVTGRRHHRHIPHSLIIKHADTCASTQEN